MVLSDAWALLRFLFVAEDDFALEPEAAAKKLDPDADRCWTPPSRRWTQLPEWAAAPSRRR